MSKSKKSQNIFTDLTSQINDTNSIFDKRSLITSQNTTYNHQGIKVYRQIENTREETRKKVKQVLRETYGYTDDNNPFGDPELSKPFIWQAKIDKFAKKGLNAQVDSSTLINNIILAKEEIDKIREKKLKREEEKKISKLMINPEKLDNQIYEEWKQKDEKFHLAQEKLRIEIRIKENREKPIDFFHKILMTWKNIYSLDSSNKTECNSLNITKEFLSLEEFKKPHLLLDILNEKELNELYSDLAIQLSIEKERLINKNFVCFYLDIEKNFKTHHNLNNNDIEDFIDFWSALLVLTEGYVNTETIKYRNEVSEELRTEIDNITKDKDFEELFNLESEICEYIKENNSNEKDNTYWKTVLYNIKCKRCIIVLEKLYNKMYNSSLNDNKQNFKDINKETVTNSNDSSLNNKDDSYNLNNDEVEYNNNERECLSPLKYTESEIKKKGIKIIDYNEYRNNLNLLKEKNLEILLKDRAKFLNKLAQKLDITIENVKQITNLTNNKSELNINNSQFNNNDNNLKNNDKDNQSISDKSSSFTESENEEINKFINKSNNNPNTSYIVKYYEDKVNNKYNKQNDTMQVNHYNNFNNNTTNQKNSRYFTPDNNTYNQNAFNYNKELKILEAEAAAEGDVILKENANIVTNPSYENKYTWANKYKPRKPRYFNRVKTGYEWNKYYQKHYDYDNPPPKVIQGYKFNIFYPELLNKSKTPQYTLESSNIKDTCIIRFSAGPPYEDICFSIINREWDMNERAGFKNIFDRGIYYLYFNFKRYRYKR